MAGRRGEGGKVCERVGACSVVYVGCSLVVLCQFGVCWNSSLSTEILEHPVPPL